MVIVTQMFDLTDLLVYADLIEDQGKDTILLRSIIDDFDYVLYIYNNCKDRSIPLGHYYYDPSRITNDKGDDFCVNIEGDGIGYPIEGNVVGDGNYNYDV